MLGNLWLTAGLATIAILSAAATYKSYGDVQKAKEIRESFEIVTEVKNLIAEKYNKNPNEVTKVEIIASLPKGKNWEKLFFLDKNSNEGSFLTDDGNFVLNEGDRIRLLALRSELRSYESEDIEEKDNSKKEIIFKISANTKNLEDKEKIIKNRVEKAVYELGELLYSTNSISLDNKMKEIVKLTPYEFIYNDMKKSGESSITDDELNKRKEKYFKKRIKERLQKSNSGFEKKLLDLVEDEL